MTTRPEALFITSVDVRQGPAHDYVTIWIRHANVGTLCVGKGDGEELRALLLGEPSLLERQAVTSEAVGFPHLADAIRTRRQEMGYVKTGEPCTLTPWMRGALSAMRDPERTRCPLDLAPDECTLEAARGQGFDDAAIAAQVRSFVDYYHGQGGVRFDWQSLLRVWFRRRRIQLDDARQPPVDPALAERARTVTRRLHATMDAEQRECARRMVERAGSPVPFVMIGALNGAPNAETIPQQLDRAERAREHLARDTVGQAILDAARRGAIDTGKSVPCPRCKFPASVGLSCPSCGAWVLEVSGPVELSGHEPPPGNWALFEGPREVIDSLLAQHDHTTAEAGPGAPAPSPPAANEKPGLESRPPGVPHAAGAPPTTMQGEHACTVIIDDPLSTARQHAIEDSWRDEGWRDEETQG